jgi:hypothetical protein
MHRRGMNISMLFPHAETLAGRVWRVGVLLTLAAPFVPIVTFSGWAVVRPAHDPGRSGFAKQIEVAEDSHWVSPVLLYLGTLEEGTILEPEQAPENRALAQRYSNRVGLDCAPRLGPAWIAAACLLAVLALVARRGEHHALALVTAALGTITLAIAFAASLAAEIPDMSASGLTLRDKLGRPIFISDTPVERAALVPWWVLIALAGPCSLFGWAIMKRREQRSTRWPRPRHPRG